MTAAACRAGLRLGSGLGFEEGDLISETEDENAVSGMNAALMRAAPRWRDAAAHGNAVTRSTMEAGRIGEREARG